MAAKRASPGERENIRAVTQALRNASHQNLNTCHHCSIAVMSNPTGLRMKPRAAEAPIGMHGLEWNEAEGSYSADKAGVKTRGEVSCASIKTPAGPLIVPLESRP